MAIKAFDLQFDDVIKSHFIVCKTNYQFAIDSLIPLIDRLDQQRNTLASHYYKKLEKDIKIGCVMPPLTLALISEDDVTVNSTNEESTKVEHVEETTSDNKDRESNDLDLNQLEDYINRNIEKAFVLDGIQRLNTLKRIGKENLDLNRPIYINFLICNSMDKLLYRMITLNNGQKPMSARHQVEILANNVYNFEDLDLNFVSEKEQKKKQVKGGFKKADIIRAYLAFISSSINIDNQKIIESKLDELITDQIIDSDIPERTIEFSDIINLMNKFIERQDLLSWFKVTNNLIGFSAAINKTYKIINQETIDEFSYAIKLFEEAFSYLDVSKIKLGMSRRRAVQYYIENYLRLKDYSINKITNEISQEV